MWYQIYHDDGGGGGGGGVGVGTGVSNPFNVQFSFKKEEEKLNPFQSDEIYLFLCWLRSAMISILLWMSWSAI